MSIITHKLYKTRQICSAAIAYFLFGLGLLVMGLFFRLVSPLPLFSASMKQRWIRNCIHLGCLAFINIMRLFGLIKYTYKLSSMQKATPGHIVVANHPSLIDAVFLFAANKNMCCLVKGALWNNFFTGPVARLAGYIPNNTIEAVPMAVAKLHGGENLLIFPEGTRNSDNNNIHFKRGAANIAVAANADILPVKISCNPPALKKSDKWYNIPDEVVEFCLSSNEQIKLNECIDRTKPKTRQYRDLTQFLEQYYLQWTTR
nr:lysophospholipid acyltransferase family protein [Alteromonas sp. 5E99-2]